MTTILIILGAVGILFLAYCVTKTGATPTPEVPRKFEYIYLSGSDARDKIIWVFNLRGERLAEIKQDSCTWKTELVIMPEQVEEISYIRENFDKVFEEI